MNPSSLLLAAISFIAGVITPPILNTFLYSITKITNNEFNQKSQIQNAISCTPERMNSFLHNETVPGFHIVCLDYERNANIIHTTVYLGATSSKISQSSSLSTFTYDKIQTQLINMISKHKSSRSYNSWSLFDTNGHIIHKFIMTKIPKRQQFLSKNPTSYMMLLVEGGTWFWPGVHVGFQRTINLSQTQTSNHNHTITFETLSIQPL